MDTPVMKLAWEENGFSNFDMYCHHSRGDGHCLLHSIANSIFIPYRTGILEGERVNRTKLMKDLRGSIASTLADVNPDSFDGKTYYQSISDGALEEFGKTNSEFTLEGLQRLLRSDAMLGEEVKVILEVILDKTIYILNDETRDLYVTSADPTERDSVVVLYRHDHFDMVSIKETPNGPHVTHFKPSHPFAIHLRNRLRQFKR